MECLDIVLLKCFIAIVSSYFIKDMKHLWENRKLQLDQGFSEGSLWNEGTQAGWKADLR
jgi:hypothetical protein